jgi:ERCC4-type nuclease
MTYKKIVPPPSKPLVIRQRGQSVRIPKPHVIVDTRENPGYNFERFSNWIGGIVRRALPTGDYSIVGLENKITVERKTLEDLVITLTHNRERFIRECERLLAFERKLIIVEASLSDIKSPYEYAQAAHPNSVLGSLIAIKAKYEIEICFLCSAELAEEYVASFLSKYHALHWLEENGFERRFIDGDI